MQIIPQRTAPKRKRSHHEPTKKNVYSQVGEWVGGRFDRLGKSVLLRLQLHSKKRGVCGSVGKVYKQYIDSDMKVEKCHRLVRHFHNPKVIKMILTMKHFHAKKWGEGRKSWQS